MRRKESLHTQVFKKLYPWHNKNTDPNSWRDYVKQNLIPEISREVRDFYGSQHEFDEMYPGLDYAYYPHRRRLARRPHHQELFKVFDELRLTAGEIRELCTWDFTLYQKQRIEREHNLNITDMTGAEIPTWDELQRQRRHARELVGHRHEVDHELEQQSKEDDTEMADESDEDERYISADRHQQTLPGLAPARGGSEINVAPQMVQHSMSANGLVELEAQLLSAARRLRATTPGY